MLDTAPASGGNLIPVHLANPQLLRIIKSDARYLVYLGGRGGGKSLGIAQILIMLAMAKPIFVVCLRHHAVTLPQSFKACLEHWIVEYGLHRHFHVTRNEIRGKGRAQGSHFSFMGVDKNPLNVKSTEGADYFVLEEAQQISDAAWMIIKPTLRKDKGKIIISANLEDQNQALAKELVVDNIYPEETEVIWMQWYNNKFFPENLNTLRKADKRSQTRAMYEHVWLGAFNNISEASVFLPYEEDTDRGHYETGNLDDATSGLTPLYGLDWGLVSSAAALVKCYIVDDMLYIADELFDYGIHRRNLIEWASNMEGAVGEGNYIISDVQMDANDRELHQAGFRAVSAAKGPGSIDEGVRRMLSYKKIVINPRCKRTRAEVALYRREIDPMTETVIPGKYVDANNDCIDAIRYALEGRAAQESLKSGERSGIQLGAH